MKTEAGLKNDLLTRLMQMVRHGIHHAPPQIDGDGRLLCTKPKQRQRTRAGKLRKHRRQMAKHSRAVNRGRA